MMTTTPDGGTSKGNGKPESAAEQGLAEEMVARAWEQGMSLTGPDELLSAATDQTVQHGLPSSRSSVSLCACELLTRHSDAKKQPLFVVSADHLQADRQSLYPNARY